MVSGLVSRRAIVESCRYIFWNRCHCWCCCHLFVGQCYIVLSGFGQLEHFPGLVALLARRGLGDKHKHADHGTSERPLVPRGVLCVWSGCTAERSVSWGATWVARCLGGCVVACDVLLCGGGPLERMGWAQPCGDPSRSANFSNAGPGETFPSTPK